MLVLFYAIVISSLKVSINQNVYEGESYEAILDSYGSEVNTITSIVVQEGDFPVNSLSNQYTDLTALEVPAESFRDSIGDGIFKNLDLLKTVIINGATSIGSSCFEGCSQLETVQFQDCLIINNNAFKSCSLLKNVQIPKVQTIKNYAFSGTIISTIESNFLTEVGDYAFNECSYLTVITAPLLSIIGSYSFKGTSFTSLSLNSVTQMGTAGHCFELCTKLEIIQLDNVESLPQYSFYNCTSLHTITGLKVKTIEQSCFHNCICLLTATFPSLLTIGSNSFQGAISLKEIDYPNVTSVSSNAFYSCSELKTVVMNSCVSVGYYAFCSCVSLSHLLMPELVTMSYCAFRDTAVVSLEFPQLTTLNVGKVDGTSDVGGQFMHCSKLTSFTAPYASSIPIWMFYGCVSLTSLSMDNAGTIGTNSFGQCTSLITICLPSVKSIAAKLFNGGNNIVHIEFDSVLSIGDNAFQNCKSLETASFINCTSVGKYAFDGCHKLETINMPKVKKMYGRAFSYTNLKKVEMNSLSVVETEKYNYADHGAQFEGCSALTHVTMRSLNYVQIEMFYNCHQLIYVDMPSLVYIYYRGFYLCDSLNNLTFPKLKSIGKSAFQNLNGLTEVNLPSVTSIGQSSFASCPNLVSFSSENCSFIDQYGFNNCVKLEHVYLPKLRELGARAFSYTNFSSIELNSLVSCGTVDYNYADHGSQFQNCESLTNVTMKMMPYIQIEMFYSCSKLEYLDVPNVNTIYYMAFVGCHALSNLTLPSIKTINSYAFQSVTGLYDVDLPSLTSIGKYAFASCPNLVSFSSENCSFIDQYGFNNCAKLEHVYLPKLRELGARAFSYTNFSSIELNSLVSCGTVDYNYADHGSQFQNCKSLTNVTMKSIGILQIEMFYNCDMLSYIDLPNVYQINQNAFAGCHQLCSLTLPSIKSIGTSVFSYLTGLFEVNLPSITSISSYAFRECPNLISITAQNCTSIGSYAFFSCAKLKTINMENVTTINSYAFDKCSSLEYVNFPKLQDLGARAFSYTGLKEVEFNTLTIAGTDDYNYKDHGAQFEGCDALTHVTMNLMTYVQIEMFYSCNNLIYIDMPNLVKINYRGFYGCSSLNNLTFPKLDIIGEDAFRENPGLIEVDLPSVTNINQYAFYKCHNLLSFSSENCSYIFKYAFYDCCKLEHIHLPKLRELGARSFAYTNLTSINLDSLGQAGTDNYNYADHGVQFQSCIELKHVSMKSMPYLQIEMFYDCSSLIEINLPSCIKFNSNCLAGCSALKQVTLGFETIQFGSIPSPQLLTHISFPNAKNVPENTFLDFKEMISCKLPLVSTVESSAFQGCLNLVDLELPSLIELIGDYNFYNCENLPSLSLRTLINVNSTSSNIFQGCRGLKYISLPDRPPKTFNRETFKDLSCKIYIPAESIDIYDNDASIDGDEAGDHKWCGIELSAFDMTTIVADDMNGVGATLSEACTAAGVSMSSVSNLRIVAGHLTQEEMMSFKDNFVDLNELRIEASVSIDGDIIPQNFLLNHKEIKTVYIFSSLKIIDESAFQGCSQLSTISCPNVKELRSKCFFGPTSLEMISFELVDTLTGSHFFSNNSILKNIELPNLKTATITGYISENSPLISSITLAETPPTLSQGKFLLDVSPFLIGISNKAAVDYDAADSVDNDMRFYSLRLRYSLFLISVDGDRINGVTLKSMVPEGAKVVEMIEGEITESDFPLPDSITSFTVRENVSVKSIPANAFAENENLKTITIFSKTNFEIKEEAFLGCTSLTYAQINKATSIEGLAFKGCSKLKTVILNDVLTIIGNSHFESCNELRSLSLQSLTTVPSTSNRIFLGCSKFSIIKLPSKPPQRFHKDTFQGLQDQLSLVLPNEEDYNTYDKDISISGDQKEDGLWCGIILPSTIVNIKINQRSNIYNGNKLSDCIIASGISESQIITLEILRGLVPITTLVDTLRNLPFLETLKISASVNTRSEYTDGYFSGLDLISVTLPGVTNIPNELFKDCKKLKYVEMNEATKIGDSAFKGCTSLESISLNVNTFEGDSQFEGCTSLTSVSITNLVNVDSTSSKIFAECPLTMIYLPETPPKTFNKNTFIGKEVIIYGLSNEVLQNYDANTDVEGDVKDDLKWCGIDLVQLYLTVSINEQQSVQSSSLASAAELSLVTEVKSIEIQQGMVKNTHMNELRTFPSLSRLTITENTILESTIIESEQFKDLTNLIHVKIMHNVTLMRNCFRGCSSLLSCEFAEVPLISEGSFRNCSSLNTLIIPRCKELRGDYIFSGCTNLRDVDLSSLMRVDSSGSKIFEDCNQLTMLRLPSVEPMTFHKDTFVDCTEVKLQLPNKADYLSYDDESHVVDDIKEDEKWCGIKIDSAFLPQFLIYRINNIEYRSRKLTNNQNKEDRLFLLEDNTTNTSELKDLELIGGLVSQEDLKNIISQSLTIERFTANIGTLTDIASGTFDGCDSLKEIVIHCEVNLGYGALQNIPNLEVLKLLLQFSIRSDEFVGDVNLREISLPLLQVVPSDTFANLTKLTKIDLDIAYSISSNCFKNCESLENLDLHSLEKIYGDSCFEGCLSLKMIDLSKLISVPQGSSRLFMNCNKLTNISLGDQPPTRFNEDIFKNAGVLPTVSLPTDNSWQNYIVQSKLESDGRYLWYGIDTGLTKDDNVSCPPQEECSCPESSECSCPESSECSCPESTNCPEVPASCPECNCEEIGTKCPTLDPAECSCPEMTDVACPTNPFTQSGPEMTMSNSMTISYVLWKSVSFSYFSSFSDIYSVTVIGGKATMIHSESYVWNFMPYVIRFYSMTSSPTFVSIEVVKQKHKITREMLIGISCGSAAVFFITLACIILYCREEKTNREFDERDMKLLQDLASDDEEKMTGSATININEPQNSKSKKVQFTDNQLNIDENQLSNDDNQLSINENTSSINENQLNIDNIGQQDNNDHQNNNDKVYEDDYWF